MILGSNRLLRVQQYLSLIELSNESPWDTSLAVYHCIIQCFSFNSFPKRIYFWMKELTARAKLSALIQLWPFYVDFIEYFIINRIVKLIKWYSLTYIRTLGQKLFKELSNQFESSVGPLSRDYWFGWSTTYSPRCPFYCITWVSEVFRYISSDQTQHTWLHRSMKRDIPDFPRCPWLSYLKLCRT